ncbi:hypothetical protein HBB16_06515 [Pseudonocardia sp. MCCB 268]|nr:hypothetical protein [Pseudonocardia cytotoxica]
MLAGVQHGRPGRSAHRRRARRDGDPCPHLGRLRRGTLVTRPIKHAGDGDLVLAVGLRAGVSSCPGSSPPGGPPASLPS